MVLPVPGGPYNNSPRAGRRNVPLKSSGFDNGNKTLFLCGGGGTEYVGGGNGACGMT